MDAPVGKGVDFGAILGGIRVLLVEDDGDIRDAFQMLLEDHGADVCPVGSAAAALVELETWTPDVLVSDIGMPGRNGYELMDEVGRRRDLPPAAAVTADVTSDGRRRALAAGFRLYLRKPIDGGTLVAAVAALAGRRYEPPEP
jgi:CheY-like chemotaxis protein